MDLSAEQRDVVNELGKEYLRTGKEAEEEEEEEECEECEKLK